MNRWSSLLYELAERCDNEEIYHFAEIIVCKAKRGNMTEIITEPCVACRRSMRFCGKLQQCGCKACGTENDDAPVTADAVVPDGELAGIYGCVVWKSGWVLVMSGCLAGYLGALFWAEKIVDIPV